MKWEYKILDVGLGDRRTVEAKLNALGDEGWELVKITPATAYLKRLVAAR